ncbi:glycosyltransferase family A protein [Altererythrobacter sp. ZODW24]|uniref:glycosyltransferase family 2 protein n=1 Tax=Altererythrobacter sp. ZODW24 TaxID=2185142 RepID=UPI000DF7D43F|nr:glycosyltransferase family A protein [Altererythrobacter sp. ZODW24]
MFSVIIPTKNRSAMLRRALASVMQQSDQDIEIIIVDDGSDEDEAREIAGLVGQTSKAQLIRFDQSKGAPTARNRAIAAAKGDYIATLDSDDWWTANRLERHRASLARENTVLSYNRAALTRSGEGDVCNHYGEGPHAARPLAVTLAGRNHIGGCSSVCFRVDAFRHVGGFDPALPSCQDWDLWLKLLGQGSAAFIDEPLTYQDIGDHDRITSGRDKVLDGHAIVQDRALAGLSDVADKRYVTAMHQYLRAEIGSRFGDRGMILAGIASSLVQRPTQTLFQSLPHLLRSAVRG